MKRKYGIVVLSKGAFARTVRIYAPSHADRAVIMHDGQNVFCDEDATYKKSWRVLDALKSCNIKNTAVIAVDSTQSRFDDYTPFPPELPLKLDGGGKADSYMEFLEQALLPYIDKRFGFKQYAMLGSSAGALATLYFAAKKSPHIKAYGLFSTPLYLSEKAFAEFFRTATFDRSAFYYVYAGGNENPGRVADPETDKHVPQFFTDNAFTLVNALRKSGVIDIALRFDNTAVHDETCWREPEKEFLKKFSDL